MPVGDGSVYHVISNQGQTIGGIMHLDTNHGVPSHWAPYASVESTDGACERLTSHKGQLYVPPTDIPNVGRFSVASDAQGAQLSLISLLPEAPRHPEKGSLGFVCWSELLTNDPEAAASFYQAVLGWAPRRSTEHQGYWLFDANDRMIAGMMQTPPFTTRPQWLQYFMVENVDVSTAKARDLGAKELVPPSDIPKMGRFSILEDPTGALIALFHDAPETK
jgi:hypothetical protein